MAGVAKPLRDQKVAISESSNIVLPKASRHYMTLGHMESII